MIRKPKVVCMIIKDKKDHLPESMTVLFLLYARESFDLMVGITRQGLTSLQNHWRLVII